MSARDLQRLEKDALAIVMPFWLERHRARDISALYGQEPSGGYSWSYGLQEFTASVDPQSATPYSVFFIGTGGDWNPVSPDPVSTGGDIGLVLQAAHRKSTARRVAVQTTADMISAIRSAFGLNMKQTAQVLRVERPTVYAWLGERAEPRPDNSERIRSLYEVALNWSRVSNVPAGPALSQPLAHGDTLLDLLAEEDLREPELLDVLPGIVHAARRRHEAKDKRGSTVRRAAERLGLSTDELEASADGVGWVTGKRGGPE